MVYQEGQLQVHSSTQSAGLRLLLTAKDADGESIPIQRAAQAMGFHHFNWVNMILSAVPEPVNYQGKSWPELQHGFPNSFALSDPFDPLPGGNLAMAQDGARLIHGLSPNAPVPPGLMLPVRDSFPYYYDEVYLGANSSQAPWEKDVASYRPSAAPEYQALFSQASSLSEVGRKVAPELAMSYEFNDFPNVLALFATFPVGIPAPCNAVTTICPGQVVGDVHLWASFSGVSSVELGDFYNVQSLGGVPRHVEADQRIELLGTVPFEEFAKRRGWTPEQLQQLGITVYATSAAPVPEPHQLTYLLLGIACIGTFAGLTRKR